MYIFYFSYDIFLVIKNLILDYKIAKMLKFTLKIIIFLLLQMIVLNKESR
jgi:hypothetical protein